MQKLFPYFKLLAVIVVAGSMASCVSAPPPRAPVYRAAPRPAAPQREKVYIPTDQLPVVMLLIDEKNLGTIPTAEAEALTAEMLMDERIRVVDQEMVRANLKKSQKLYKMAGDNRAAASMGMQFGADVVFSGSAVAKPAARRIADSNLRSYEAVVTLSAIDTDTSRKLASASESATIVAMEEVTGGSKALKTATRKTMDKLLPRFLESWASYGATCQGEGDVIVMTVGGVDAMWKLKAVRELLEKRKDLARDVTQKSYTAGVAVFEVNAAVPSAELAEQLLLNAPKGLRMQVLEVDDNKLNVRVVSR